MVLGKTTVTLFAGYENKRALHTDVHCEYSRFLYRTAAALSDMCDADWERRKKNSDRFGVIQLHVTTVVSQ